MVGTRRTYVMRGQFYVSLYTVMYRTWCWAGWHWLGSALRKKARKKGFSTGGIQSTLTIRKESVVGAEHLSLRREPDGPAGVDLSAEVLL